MIACEHSFLRVLSEHPWHAAVENWQPAEKIESDMRALLTIAAVSVLVLGSGGAYAQDVFIVEPPVYVAPYYWPAPVIVAPYAYNSREGKAESLRWGSARVCFRGFPCSRSSAAMNRAGEWEPGPFIE
jgi:hypothetical protein